jgi:pimeloyl-ACP methyl ester carboxylesterase
MGDGDKSFSLETAVKSTEMEQKLVVRLVNGAGHAPHQQAAPLVNKLILTFLAGICSFRIRFPREIT